MGPLALTLLAIAVLAAVLRAWFEQQARRHRTSEKQPGERRILPIAVGENYTGEGERYLRLARTCRILLFLFGFGAIAATWKGF
jgi:hypothetical protein